MRLPRPPGGASLSIPVNGTPHMAAPPSTAQLTLSDVIRVLRSNAWLIILMLILSIAGGYGANKWLAMYHARYTATGWIEVQAPINYDIVKGGPTGQDPGELALEQTTTAQLLKTPTLFTEVLKLSDVRETEWFHQFQNSPMGQVPAALLDLNDSIVVSPLSGTKLITVSMSYKDPVSATVVCENLIKQHIEDQTEEHHTDDENRAVVLNEARTRYEHSKFDVTINVQNEAAKLNINAEGSSARMIAADNQLANLTRVATDLQITLNNVQVQLEDITSQINDGVDPIQVTEEAERDPQVEQAKNILTDLKFQQMSLSQSGPASNNAKDLANRVEVAQKMYDDELARAKNEVRAVMLSNLKNQILQVKRSQATVEDGIKDCRAEQSDLSLTMAQYLVNKEEEAGYVDLIKDVDNQLDLLRNTSAMKDANGVIFVRHPIKPDSPSFPKMPITMSIAIMLGLGLSLGIAFAREVTDTSIRSPRDITRVGNINLLGMVVHESDDPQSTGANLPLVIYEAPHSMMAEQLRQVRTRLQHASSLDTTRSILVTGPSPDDGKTTIACNLAAGLALNGRRILLVDANFRRPKLHQIFGMENEQGFADVLSSIDSFEHIVQESSVPNLFVLPSGNKPANVTELLESQLLNDFIERALEEFDHVVFDSGPLLFVSETVALAPRVDGVVTVIRARANSRGVLTRMRDTLRQIKAEHLGIVLNAVRAQGGGYYGRNIRTYYAYQSGKRMV
jgi:capsular exopolysaccharide synthesis family protein